ncbi:hypothetical protein [Microbacterium sp. UFMG61]|uniref:hypothetical protein n=1 Tax=Microbacterium sp. UFMG61 TaxID=2745935 RepID=UPI00188E6036|nr:hypothetical protein [Microbacterium sp. UFMG61]
MSETQWTDRDDAELHAESLPITHPVRLVQAFIGALKSTDPEAADVLATLITPESEADWADYGAAREFANRPMRISLATRYDPEAPDVAYVKFAPDEGAWISGKLDQDNVLAWATLVWRPEISKWGPLACWRIHRIGPWASASELPRSVPGFDPQLL